MKRNIKIKKPLIKAAFLNEYFLETATDFQHNQHMMDTAFSEGVFKFAISINQIIAAFYTEDNRFVYIKFQT